MARRFRPIWHDWRPDGAALEGGERRPDRDARPGAVPADQELVPELTPWAANLGDALFLNKLLLWNQAHLSGHQAFPHRDPHDWPLTAHRDPEG